ncbi:MAG: hypothetical protein ACK4M7_07040, partial [Burkholderiales bacterium]
SPYYDGNITLALHLAGNDSSIPLTLQGKATQVTFQNMRLFPLIHFNADFANLLTELQGNLKINAQGIASLKAELPFKQQKNQLVLQNATLDFPGGNMVANIGINLSNFLVNGMITGQVSDLHALPATILPVPMSGSSAFTAHLLPLLSKQAANIDIKGSDLHYEDTLTLEQYGIKLNTKDLHRLAETSLEITTQDADLKGFKLRKAQLALNGSLKRALISIEALGAEPTDRLTGKGEWQQASQSLYHLNFHHLSGNYKKTPFLSKNTELSIKEAFLSWHMPKLQIVQGTITSTGKIESNKINAHLKTEHLPLKLLPTSTPPSIQHGLVNGEITFTGSLTNPQGSAKLLISQLGHSAAFPLYHALLAGTLENQQLSSKFTLYGEGIEKFNLQANVPLYFSLLPFQLALSPNQNPTISLIAQLNLASIARSLLPKEHQLKGQLTASLTADKWHSFPQLKGTIHYTHGEYRYLPLKLFLSDMNAALEARGEQLHLQQLSAKDQKNGFIHGKGHIYPSSTLPKLDLTLIAHQFRPLRGG